MTILMLKQLALFGALLGLTPIVYRLMRGYPITRDEQDELQLLMSLPLEEIFKIRQLAMVGAMGWFTIIGCSLIIALLSTVR